MKKGTLTVTANYSGEVLQTTFSNVDADKSDAILKQFGQKFIALTNGMYVSTTCVEVNTRNCDNS